MSRLVRAIVVVLSAAVSLPAQLLPEQRVFDFQTLAALYAKRYAPLEWKRDALRFDLLDLSPWLDRVRNAKDDIEYYEIQAEYAASLQDTHSYAYLNSTYRADLGITLDIYDGKVLIDGINRTRLPAASFPFAIGDELVAVDGKTAAEWIAAISKWRAYGNPATTRRNAAASIAVRSQATFPRAPEIGDTAVVTVRRASGDLEIYNVPWTKTGVPVSKIGPSPMPHATRATAAADPLEALQTWSLPPQDPLYAIGIGGRLPLFLSGFPISFVQRLGRSSSDFHFSGTYNAGLKSIGYIRIPSFNPPSTAAAVAEINSEIDYMQHNTDGLIIDVMRNPGGGCHMFDLASRLIPYPFYFFGQQVRVTYDMLISMQAAVDQAKAARRDDWIVAVWQDYLNAYQDAIAKNRGLTRPIAACGPAGSTWPPAMEENQPAAVVYTKPMIVLIDEFSISAADIFPSMIQDNARAPLVGMRTSGGGGSVSNWTAGTFSESYTTNTNTLVMRKSPIVTNEYPTAPYVENIGARPDIPLDYMTRENLMTGGRPFVEQFTQIMLDEIQKSGK